MAAVMTTVRAMNLHCHNKGGRPVEPPSFRAKTRAENYMFQTTSKQLRPYSVIAAQAYSTKKRRGQQPRETHRPFFTDCFKKDSGPALLMMLRPSPMGQDQEW